MRLFCSFTCSILLLSFIIITDKDTSERLLSVLLLSSKEMYQPPVTAHGFNHQSLYRQPVSNLKQINEVIWNRDNRTEQIGGSIPHQQFASTYENLDEQSYSSLKDPNKVWIPSDNSTLNNHVNGLSKHIPTMTKTDHLSTRRMNFTL